GPTADPPCGRRAVSSCARGRHWPPLRAGPGGSPSPPLAGGLGRGLAVGDRGREENRRWWLKL
ncbi:hypothetical protein BHE74_00055935, partial [Ensete ventricosum]